MSDAIVAEIAEQVAALPDCLQRTVLAIVHALEAAQGRGLSPRELDELGRAIQTITRGLANIPLSEIPGRELLPFVGAIRPDDLELMAEAIESGCEQVDDDEW
ncbi:MAG: hypothetical protein FJZ90_15280 [Chloroflexi bacterium]|nr:hypothetical protein [Chloroflexota bacterium]